MFAEDMLPNDPNVIACFQMTKYVSESESVTKFVEKHNQFG